MERVKGIEPSYSAWKAAALPLSYTRAGVELTRRAGGLNPPRRSVGTSCGAAHRPVRALNRGRFAAYIDVSINPTKGGDPVSLTKRCHLAGIAR